MMSKRVLTAAAVLVGSLILAPAAAADHIQVVVDEDTGTTTVTFEGGSHGERIHPELAYALPDSGMTFTAAWAIGTAGAFENNPSGAAIGLWTSGSSAVVTFDPPVAAIGFWYSSVDDFSAFAYAADEALVDEASAVANAASDAPQFRFWDELSLAGDDIVRLEIQAAPVRLLVDDLWTRTTPAGEPGSGPSCTEIPVDVRPGSHDNPLNLRAKGRLPVALLSTPVLDATAVDWTTVLASVAGSEAAGSPAVKAWAEDADGDGLIDMVLHFAVPSLVDEGGFTQDSDALGVAASFNDGTPGCGQDAVTIVGGR